jgi:murein L,D-transpeptidase YcbB/YkuD
MKKITMLLMQTLLFAAVPNVELKHYQDKYSLCNGKNDYQISKCLLNGNLNFYNFRGDTNSFKKTSTREIKNALNNGNIYNFTMNKLPHTKRYNTLVEYLDHLYSIKSQYLVPQFKNGNSKEIDDEDIVRIKRVFNLLDNAGLEETPQRTPQFEEALLEYQRRHGLTVDGDIGPRTKRELQQSINSIIKKVKKNLTLERVTKPKGSNYVLINIPEFKMHYYNHDEPVLDMKVVVGKTKMRTPVFSRELKYIVKNPRWNVPPSIYKKEYAHKSESQLRKLGLRYNSEGKLYQPSGRRNALGVVKFLFPNKFNVYMHDTPSKYIFARTVRAYSHGCIRLEKPIEFLNELGYKYNSKKNTWITLDHQIPVYVEYHTVWADDDGVVQFRDDIYGYEKKLFSKVKYRPKAKAKTHRKKRKTTQKEDLELF